ncbi:MAG: hypothetical protein CSA95_09235 [Bacteroidetes bacterium]|nr:MAG: hypothetical protein CSA95_09235 [Bacteroidota bacterium]
MKTRNNILLLSIAAMLCCSLSLRAQDRFSIKKRWNINLGIAPDFTSSGREPGHEFKLSAHYGVNSFLALGGYTGYSKYIYFLGNNNPLGVGNRFLYGISAKAHILPFFIQSEDFRFDLYLNSRMGIDHRTGNPNKMAKSVLFRLHVGSGLAFYPFNRWGIFVEYGYDNHGIIDYHKHWVFEGGIVYKFRLNRGCL